MLHKIAQTRNKVCRKHLVVFSSKFCLVTYLEFLHASIIQDGTSNNYKTFGENYLVEFSVSHKMHFL